MPLLIRGGTVVSSSGTRRADVLVDGERIAAVGEDLSDADGVELIDAGGALVIPGGIDVHTHLALPVGTPTSADDFESGTIAAACGGTTCVLDFAGAGRERWDEALTTWHMRAAKRAVVDYGFHLTVTELPKDLDDARERFRAFASEGVTSVKLYLAYPERLMVDDDTLSRALVAARDTGVRVCIHAEDGATIERNIAEALAAGRTGVEAIPDVRPPSVEAEAIRRAAKLARDADAWLYVVHLSSRDGLQAVRGARGAGVDIHAETCPQYLFLDDARLREGDQDVVCAPPIRGASDREELWSALGAGDVEVFATDHCPFTKADRRGGTTGEGWQDFIQIPAGLPGVEARVPLLYQGVRDGRLTLERWVDAIATAPARLFGLDHRKGTIEPGLDADLVVFDPEATTTLDAAALHSRSDHSPYEGMAVTGWPALTISRGTVVARDGEPADAGPGHGRFVPRTTAARGG